jgi:O-antigen/teichoic acid export membrane protein
MLSKHSKNMLWVFSGDTGSKLLGFLATVYLARVIGDEGYGMVSIGLAVLAYGIMFISSGIPLYGTQMVASAVKNIACFTGNVIQLRIVLATLAVGVTVICVMVFAPTGALYRIITIYALFLFPLSLSLDWFFQGKSRMAVVAVSRFIQIVIYLLFILYTVDHINHVDRVAWGWVAGGLGAAAWTWWQFRRSNYPVRILRDLRRLLDLWKNSLPLGVAMLITQVAQQFPFIYLGWRYDNAAAGQFGVAFRLMLALLVLDRIFYTVFFPAISRQAAQQVQSLSATVNTITKSVGVVALTTAMAAVLLAPWMIPILFSDTYHSAVPLFQIMAGYFALLAIPWWHWVTTANIPGLLSSHLPCIRVRSFYFRTGLS